MDIDINEAPAVKQKISVLSDPQFVALFNDTSFEIDEESHKFGLFILSAVAQKDQVPKVEDEGWGHGKIASEDEEEEKQ